MYINNRLNDVEHQNYSLTDGFAPHGV
ncbi:hypothetical protein CNEO4_1790011 [Clostridium neonatale]|uniref:Uncharacterized protein n=1 Tax=Clostridium neonatale TaxID=137838 RepID=A0AA86JGT9_9CLOT|nr:hypothetical protein CNEO_40222 [Clostridium neonatale]CAG9712565.1 hypothetical protein CNEO_1720014 [Clostridium neonatale]CAG9714266.1 hypothetical protein CNEO_80093 [Clostridium neonatale]CAI3195094.1 hypothetical protein CNEO2_120014 [Clostridium neonatale]CAI3197118.1 hypothetical protein CNEO2_190024 [Clostridium neonatale]